MYIEEQVQYKSNLSFMQKYLVEWLFQVLDFLSQYVILH